MNLYAYVGNDPVNATDPTGKFLQFLVPIIIGITASAPANAPAPGEQTKTMSNMDVVGAIVPAARVESIATKVGAEAATSATNALKLEKQLASEAQSSKILSGNGDAIAGAGTNKELRDAPRLEAEHGGKAGDWSKVDGGNHTARDGSKVETHGYENKTTGQIVELKTKLKDEGR